VWNACPQTIAPRRRVQFESDVDAEARWVKGRLCLALGCLSVVVSCAGQTQVRPAPSRSSAGDALYDQAAEWSDANRLPELPRRPRATRPRVVFLSYAFEPAGELRRVSGNDLLRSRSVQPIVRAASHTHAVASDLVNGIIWVESRFQVRARSNKGACGLMQLMPRTGREVARAIGMPYHPYEPRFNIHAGTYYFSRLVERYRGDHVLALAAYNIGPGRVDGWLQNGEPLPGVSRAYVDNVFGAARAFRQYE
jgi:soluble lytic murein transglycosylase-like protein